MIETKFKQTEIGLIPEDWEKSSVGETFLHVNSNTLSRDCLNYESGIAQNVHYGDVLVKYGEIVDAEKDELPYINDDIGITINPNVLLRSGDVVVADTAEDETAGKATELINVNSDIVAGLHTIVNRPKQDLFFPKYLGYFFNSSLYHNQLLPHMQGIKVLSLSKKAIDTPIVVYPKDKKEQKRIAEALSNIDQLIFSLSKIIEKKRLIKQGAMQQLLTGKKRLPGFEGEWNEKYLGEIGITYNGIVGKTKDDFGKGDAKYITFLNILNNPIINITILEKVNISPNEGQFEVQLGDLFFNTSSETPEEVGICSYLNNSVTNVYLNSFCFGYRLMDKSVSGLFLSYYFRSELGRTIMYSLAQGSTRYNLSKDSFKKISIVVPSTIQEQMAIVEILTTMDNEIDSLEEERDKYIRLKEGMMQKLLTGQIRLVEAETKQHDLPERKTANVYFKRSVLAAEIADRLCEERTFGHVKMEKLIFLTEHLCHIDIDSHYHRDAAGPYDNRALRSIDSQMKKQKWFEAKKEGKRYRYVPMQNRGGHKKYFEKYYADVMPMFEKIIETFKTSSTEQCEIVATLYSAWDDLLQNHQPFTDDDILNEVLNNWNETKKRIKRSRWQAALDWMRNQGFTPQ